MKNMSLGMKIASGFLILIIISIALGAMAIYNMGAVETQSTMLAHEYVPEVAVANELRGAYKRVMYEIRGYGFTEDDVFYKDAQKEMAAVDAALEQARTLEANSPNLKALKGQIEVATKAVEEYKKLMEQTVETNAKLAANREVLDSSAAKYMTNSNAFLAGQNENFKIDLNERQKKIDLVTDLVDTGASTRVLNFKSQALGDPELMNDAISTIGGIGSLISELRGISRSKDDIERINKTEQAAREYQNAMRQFLAEYKKGSLASTGILNGFRREMDTNAGIYVKNCDEFLEGQ